MPEFLKKIMNSDEELNINITSMIDVIFILLIFFMVSTQFKKSSLPLDLPQTEETELSKEDDSLKVLAVTKDSIELDNKVIAFEELEESLNQLYQANPEVTVSLECEKTVEFERVVQVLSKLQNAGISKIGIIYEALDN